MSSYPQPFEWLGLLKWSLNYTDGTRNTNISPMSTEDRAFLEEVMKHGIVNEGERMKEILSEITTYLDQLVHSSTSTTHEEKEDEIQSLLMELRDIVGLIDYAKMFTAMGGLKFLMGMSLEPTISTTLKTTCMAVLATLCQNNPTVQKTMLDQGNIPLLMDLFFSLVDSENSSSAQEMFSIRIMQAMSATVRDFVLAEEIFCSQDKTPRFIESGLGISHEMESTLSPVVVPLMLRKKTLFFLQALLTSDSSNPMRLRLFQSSIDYVVRHFLHPDQEPDLELREMTLSLLVRILEQQVGSSLEENTKLYLKDFITQRITTFHETQEQDELEQEELQLCQQLLDLLTNHSSSGRSTGVLPSSTTVTASSPYPMLLAASADRSHESMPQ